MTFWTDNVLKEVITNITVPALGTKVQNHRLGLKPNRILVEVTAGKGIIRVTASDALTFTLTNTGSETTSVKVYLERFHTIEGDVGLTDASGVTPVYTDGLDDYQDVEVIDKALLEAAITNEDPWIRYVRTDGDDSNDGKSDSPTGAWKTIGHLLTSKPKINEFGVGKVGPGIFNEKVDIRGNLGRFALVGSWEEVYKTATISAAGYSRYDVTNTVEGWARITVVNAGDLPIDWKDLIGMYAEIAKVAGTDTYRLKIVDTDKANNRIYLGGYPRPSGIINQTLKIVREATIITQATFDHTVRVAASSQDPCEYNSTYGDLGTTGILLHAIKIANTNPAAFTLLISKSAAVSLGQVTIDLSVGYGAIVYGTIGPMGYSLPLYFGSIASVIDGRVTNICNSLQVDGSSLSPARALTVYGLIQKISLYAFNANSFIAAYSERSQVDMEFWDVCVLGRIQLVYNPKVHFGRTNPSIRLGCLMTSVDLGRPEVSFGKTTMGQKIGFYGSVDASFGRIYMYSAFMVASMDIDFGDCSGLAAAIPLMTITKDSTALIGKLLGGSLGKEVVAASPLIKVEKGSKAILKGDMVLYHGNDVTQPESSSMVIDGSSEVAFEDGAKLTINAKTKGTAGDTRGILQIEGKGKLNMFGVGAADLTINHSVGTGGKMRDILLNSGELLCEGKATIASNLGGLSGGASIENYNGKLVVIGDIEQTIPNETPYHQSGKDSYIDLVGRHTVNGMVALQPMQYIEDGKADFHDDILCPSADYGAGVPIHRYENSARVAWHGPVTPGDAVNNRNTNATGLGVRLRRDAHLVINNGQVGGPDGGVGVGVDIGAGGITAWPAGADTSVSDIPSGANSQGCFVHRKA